MNWIYKILKQNEQHCPLQFQQAKMFCVSTWHVYQIKYSNFASKVDVCVWCVYDFCVAMVLIAADTLIC